MKKLTIILAITLCITISLCGCNKLFGTDANPDDVYSKLSSLAGNPSGSTELDGSVTFVAQIVSEPFEETFDDEEKVYTYQIAVLSRNWDDPIYLDVSDIGTRLPEYSFAKITGTVAGSVYWTADNKKQEVLDFHVTGMEAFTVSEEEPSTENRLSLSESSYAGTFEFVGAHRSQTSFDDVVVVYFKFTNDGKESNVKMNGIGTLLKRTDIYIGDSPASIDTRPFDPDELDSSALEISTTGAYTPPGKTQLYYMVLGDVENAQADDPVWIDFFDDEFAFKNSIGIPIANSLEEMNQ